MLTDKLLDSLLYTEVTPNKSEDIDRKLYGQFEKTFGKLKHTWSKAMFLYQYTSSRIKEKKAMGDKLLWELRYREHNYYENTFSHYFDEISHKRFANDNDWFLQKFIDLFSERGGEHDYIMLAQEDYKATGKVPTIPGVTLTSEMIEQIKN